MSENAYTNQIKELVQGERAEISVEQPEFMVFREAWLACPDRKKVVGEAGLNGKVIYRFQKEM